MDKKQQPLGELFVELKQETVLLIQKEMELLRIEVSQKMVQIVKDLVAMGIGGVLLHCGLLTIIAAIVLGVAEFMAPWLSALVVGVVLCALGGVLVQKGRKEMSRLEMVPEKTTQTLKETAKWAKSQMK